MKTRFKWRSYLISCNYEKIENKKTIFVAKIFLIGFIWFFSSKPNVNASEYRKKTDL